MHCARVAKASLVCRALSGLVILARGGIGNGHRSIRTVAVVIPRYVLLDRVLVLVVEDPRHEAGVWSGPQGKGPWVVLRSHIAVVVVDHSGVDINAAVGRYRPNLRDEHAVRAGDGVGQPVVGIEAVR